MTRTMRIVDEWMKLCALALAKEAAGMPDGREKREMIENSWRTWQCAHGREVQQ